MSNQYIIDTNVIAVANNMADHLSEKQILKCQTFVLGLFTDTCFSIDSMNLIFDEYFTYASRKGEPGIGSALAKYIWDHIADQAICEVVPIITCPEPHFFSVFKTHNELLSFDKSDLKFIAVCIDSNKMPVICNACDSDWKEKKELLDAKRIRVLQIIE